MLCAIEFGRVLIMHSTPSCNSCTMDISRVCADGLSELDPNGATGALRDDAIVHLLHV